MARNRVLQYEKNKAYGEMMGRFVYKENVWREQSGNTSRDVSGLVCDEWQQLWHSECLLVFQTLV